MVNIDIQPLLDRHAAKDNKSSVLFDVLKTLPQISENGPWLAGGSVRRLISGDDPLASDLDFFFSSAIQAEDFENDLISLGFVRKNSNKHATTYTGKIDSINYDKDIIIQCIKIDYYSSIESCLDSFDYTICQFGMCDFDNLVHGDYSLWDLAKKRLAVNKISFAAASIRRMLKYGKQGFTVCNGVIAEVLNAVAERPGIINADIEYID